MGFSTIWITFLKPIRVIAFQASVFHSGDRHGQIVRIVGTPILFAVLIWMAVAVWFLAVYGGVRNGVRAVRGYRVVVEQSTIDVSTVEKGAIARADFVLRNISRQPVTFLGAEPDCGCVQMSGLPLTLAPRSSHAVSMAVRTADLASREEFVHQSRLILDVVHPEVLLTIRGTVR